MFEKMWHVPFFRQACQLSKEFIKIIWLFEQENLEQKRERKTQRERVCGGEGYVCVCESEERETEDNKISSTPENLLLFQCSSPLILWEINLQYTISIILMVIYFLPTCIIRCIEFSTNIEN